MTFAELEAQAKYRDEAKDNGYPFPPGWMTGNQEHTPPAGIYKVRAKSFNVVYLDPSPPEIHVRLVIQEGDLKGLRFFLNFSLWKDRGSQWNHQAMLNFSSLFSAMGFSPDEDLITDLKKVEDLKGFYRSDPFFIDLYLSLIHI